MVRRSVPWKMCVVMSKSVGLVPSTAATVILMVDELASEELVDPDPTVEPVPPVVSVPPLPVVFVVPVEDVLLLVAPLVSSLPGQRKITATTIRAMTTSPATPRMTRRLATALRLRLDDE